MCLRLMPIANHEWKRIVIVFGFLTVNGCFHVTVVLHLTNGHRSIYSIAKVVARMSGQEGLLLSEEQLWAAFRDAHKCFQVEM